MESDISDDFALRRPDHETDYGTTRVVISPPPRKTEGFIEIVS